MKKPVLTAVIAAVVMLLLAACGGDPPDPFPIQDMPSLRQVYTDYFSIGNIIANRYRNDFGDSRRLALLRHHFNLLTAENEMKPNVLRTGTSYPGGWNWRQAEELLTFAEGNNMRFHGHTLAWHSQSHRWLAQDVTPEVAVERLQRHIQIVMRHFGNRVESWDVLNEVIISGGPGRTDNNIFTGQLLGDLGFSPASTPAEDLPFDDPAWNWRVALRTPDNVPNETNWPGAINVPTGNESCFVEIAFLEARKVRSENDWDMILYYNDYNLNIPRKRLAVYHMVRDINSRHPGLIQAIGMQAHYWLPGNVGGENRQPPAAVCVFDVRDSLVRFASLGVYISITELDVFAGPGRGREQAIMYARLFQLFRSFAMAQEARGERGLRRVSIWGVDDPSSWRSQYSPLLFDGHLNPKQAFWAVADPDAFLAEHAPQYLGEFDDDCFTVFHPQRP